MINAFVYCLPGIIGFSLAIALKLFMRFTDTDTMNETYVHIWLVAAVLITPLYSGAIASDEKSKGAKKYSTRTVEADRSEYVRDWFGNGSQTSVPTPRFSFSLLPS